MIVSKNKKHGFLWLLFTSKTCCSINRNNVPDQADLSHRESTEIKQLVGTKLRQY